MIQYLVQMMQDESGDADLVVKRKQFALYCFENIVEYHLSDELITKNA